MERVAATVALRHWLMHHPRAQALGVFVAVLAAAYFALWACATRPHATRPATLYVPDGPAAAVGAPDSEFGFGVSYMPEQGTCRPLDLGRISPACESGSVSLWQYWRAGSWLDWGFQLQGDYGWVPSGGARSNARSIGIGALLRPLLVQSERVQFGLDFEGGLMALDVGLPLGVNLGGDLWLYTEPSLDVASRVARMPLGLTIPLGSAGYLALESGGLLGCGDTGASCAQPMWYLGAGLGIR